MAPENQNPWDVFSRRPAPLAGLIKSENGHIVPAQPPKAPPAPDDPETADAQADPPPQDPPPDHA